MFIFSSSNSLTFLSKNFPTFIFPSRGGKSHESKVFSSKWQRPSHGVAVYSVEISAELLCSEKKKGGVTVVVLRGRGLMVFIVQAAQAARTGSW